MSLKLIPSGPGAVWTAEAATTTADLIAAAFAAADIRTVVSGSGRLADGGETVPAGLRQIKRSAAGY